MPQAEAPKERGASARSSVFRSKVSLILQGLFKPKTSVFAAQLIASSPWISGRNRCGLKRRAPQGASSAEYGLGHAHAVGGGGDDAAGIACAFTGGVEVANAGADKRRGIAWDAYGG